MALLRKYFNNSYALKTKIVEITFLMENWLFLEKRQIHICFKIIDWPYGSSVKIVPLQRHTLQAICSKLLFI